MKLIEDLMRGLWVHGFDADVAEMLAANEDRCFRLNSLPPRAREERNALLKEILGEIHDPFIIHSPFHCDFGSHIFIGCNFTSNFNLTILDEAEVRIGNNVFIGPNCGLYTINHALLPDQRNEGIMRAHPIRIADNVWLGANVTVLPGVTVGEGAVIAAGSVVTRDIPPSTLAAGNPCRPLREISEQDRVKVVDD